MKISLLSIFLLGISSRAFASPDVCVKITIDSVRLACFDAAFASSEEKIEAPGDNDTEQVATENASEGQDRFTNWQIRSDKSPLTDEKSIFVSTYTMNTIQGPYGGYGRGELLLRCLENTTSAFLIANGHFLSDIQGYGRVEYRLGNASMQYKNFTESTDNKALGLWNGGLAIPFIKSLFGNERLVVRLTPFNESPLIMEFDISGAKDVVEDLATACNWSVN